MKATEPDLEGLRMAKIIFWVLFHLMTFGIFLIPHALLHYIFGGNRAK